MIDNTTDDDLDPYLADNEHYLREIEIERLTAERANRYWEGRWRDEKAENERLKALLRRHHLRGAYWDSELAVETRAALEDKP